MNEIEESKKTACPVEYRKCSECKKRVQVSAMKDSIGVFYHVGGCTCRNVIFIRLGRVWPKPRIRIPAPPLEAV